MATGTRSKSKDNKASSGAAAGVIMGAAVAGAAVGLAANMGRKLFVQLTSASAGDWFDTLKAEHQMVLALFDKLEATDDSQISTRQHLVAKLKYALSKHAIQEENVIYPALREADERQAADHLTADHGYVKTYLFELEGMAKDDPAFLPRVGDFRAMLAEHMREEEKEIFPEYRARMSDARNAELTKLMNKEGFSAA